MTPDEMEKALAAARRLLMDRRLDGAFMDGVKAGWNAAQSDDPSAAIARIHEAHSRELREANDDIKAARALLSARASVVEECAKVADQMAADWLSRLGNAPDTTPIRTLNWLANMRSAAVGIAAAIRALNSNK